MAEYSTQRTKIAFYIFTYVLYREKHMELYMFVATQRWLLGTFMSGVL